MGAACPLCTGDGGVLVSRNEQLRVIQADEPGFPAFYRVIWNTHVAELSDLTAAEQGVCMNAVVAVERALRAELQPTKINLAALGNMVPHLHWHVVARFEWDSHFPAPLWAPAQRPLDAERLSAVQAQLHAVNEVIAKTIAT
jgi:diadenosine tetraphosphate (Ap4A) HIT family hydrolase